MGEEQLLILEPSVLAESSLAEEPALTPETALDEQQDAVAIFLEKHGNELTRNHEGELITYYRAVEECPALPMLIRALGEKALALTAATLPEVEETTEEEVVAEGAELEADNKTEQKQNSTEQTDRKVPREEFVRTKKFITQNSNQENTNPVTAEAGPASKATSAKSEISLASGTSSLPLFEATASGPTPHEVKANAIPTPAIPEDIIKISHLTAERRTDSDSKSPGIIQRTPILSLPESAKNTPLVRAERIEEDGEPLDISISPEPKNEVSITEQSPEMLVAEDEEYRVPLVEVDSFSEETVDLQSEVTLEDELLEQEVYWASTEVLHLREFHAEDEIDTEPVLLFEANSIGVSGDLPVEEVELTIIELVETIEAMDGEEAERVFEILDEIALKIEGIITPLQIEGDSLEEGEPGRDVEVVEADVEEELKELFVELFDYIGMEYTPELIEAFTKLAFKMDVSELIPKAELVEKPGVNPGEGTHEIIKQLLGALKAIKQAAERAYAIGKSVLLLYRRQLAAV